MWRDPALFASEDDTDDATAAEAADFAGRLAERLQVDPGLVIPAYEDIHYYLWSEHRLPANVLAEDAKLRDPLERARLAKVFGQGLHSAVGSVLPLRRVIDNGVAPLAVRQMVLPRRRDVPGSRRHPHRPPPAAGKHSLGSIPNTIETDSRARSIRARATACRRARRCTHRRRPSPAPDSGIEDFRPVPQELPVIGQGEPELVRTALAVEPRDGKMHVFLPPLFAVEDWLDLTRRRRGNRRGNRPHGRSGRLSAAGGRAADCISPSPPIPA